MNNLKAYSEQFHLVKEMLETGQLIANFEDASIVKIFNTIREVKKVLLTGEGSSRIFPAHHLIYRRLNIEQGPFFTTQSATDLSQKELMNYAVIGASNSGRTKEVIQLFEWLRSKGHEHLYGLTCTQNSLLETCSNQTVMLNTGKEYAVAATKSVVLQALFYHLLLNLWTGEKLDLHALASDFENTLTINANSLIIDTLSKAEHVYFAGLNNGVAEELTLKTNEIIRKKSAFFPGTYLLHGVEEVVTDKDVIVLCDYLPEHAQKIYDIYVKGIGTPVIAFSKEATLFPTVMYSSTHSSHDAYCKLAAGWNILAFCGISLGIDLDKPQRARKIGNEVSAQ